MRGGIFFVFYYKVVAGASMIFLVLVYIPTTTYTMCPVDTATAGSWAGVGLVN
jgi:hypothetical protein